MSDDLSLSIPQDIEAEQAALGSMMLSADALMTCLEKLEARWFFRPAHKVIFEVIKAMADEGEPVDILTVKAELERRGEVASTGGAIYLHDLTASVPSAAFAGKYADRVRECGVRWLIAEAGTRMRQAALDGGADLAERIEAACRIADEVSTTTTPSGARSIADLIGPAIDELEKGTGGAMGIPSGWTDLDTLIPGMRGGEMITVGGRPGMGKSVVMLNMAIHAGVDLGLPGLICTLEMSTQECIERILSFQGTVDLRKIRARSLDDRDWQRIATVHSKLTACGNLMINDDPYMSIASIRSDLRAMARAGHPAQFLVFDYLGLLSNTSGKTENRQQEVSAFSRNLKLLGKEYDIPVIIGSQLNRGPELRSDHRPIQADLRDSGSVEQDSDIVILLYRDDVYEDESPRAGEIDLIVAKNRHGQKGTVTLAFRGHYAMCGEMWTPSGGGGNRHLESA